MTATLIQPTFELDLRTIPPRERHPMIFGRFDALATGQALQLVNDHNPQPLRYQFEDRALGQFEWATPVSYTHLGLPWNSRYWSKRSASGSRSEKLA